MIDHVLVCVCVCVCICVCVFIVYTYSTYIHTYICIQRWVVTSYIYFVTFTVTNTFRVYLKMGTFTLTQVHF